MQHYAWFLQIRSHMNSDSSLRHAYQYMQLKFGVTKAMSLYLINSKCDIKFDLRHQVSITAYHTHTHACTRTHTLLVINALRGGHRHSHRYTHTCIPMPKIKAISKNQVHAWFKIVKQPNCLNEGFLSLTYPGKMTHLKTT